MKIDIRDADLRESALVRPSPQPLRQCGPVDALLALPASHGEAILGSTHWHWADEAATAAAAAALALRPALRDAVVELHGPLGAGKTTFVRHLLRALGVPGRVRSPTFTVLESYRAGTLSIAHLDFYRFADPHEWDDAGLRDVFAAPGLKLVEWAARAGIGRPPPDLALEIEPQADGTRSVEVTALSERGRELIT